MISALLLMAVLATASPASVATPGAPASVAPNAATPTAAAPAPAGSAPLMTPAASTIPATPLAPTPLATQSPYKYRFVPRISGRDRAGVPHIFAVYLNDRKLRSSGPILIKVETTPDVVKVVSRSNGRDGIVPLVSPGDFEASSVLPKIPFIAAGMTLDLEFIATTAEGKKSIVRVPVRLD